MSEKQTISVTRGLTELKLSQAKIEALYGRAFIGIQRGGKKIGDRYTEDEYIAAVKENHQAITDLIERRKQIKSAIVKSNAVTQVTVSGKTMTVAEAIERKNAIKTIDLPFLSILRKQLMDATQQLNSANTMMENKLQTMLEQNFGKDSKTSKEDVDAISVPYRKANEVKFVDPLDLAKIIDIKMNEINDFTAEVDFVLSESNTITKIAI